MQTSEQINDIAAALAKAQGSMSQPSKNRTVKVQTKTGGSYTFDYATFDEILRAVQKPLAENGIAFIQAPRIAENGKVEIITRLIHQSGQWIESILPVIVTESGNQAMGSALTYAKRYALTAMLGVAAEEDDDGNAAQGNTIAERQDRSAPARQQTKTAAPKTNGNGEAWKADAERIKVAIKGAKDPQALDDLLDGERETLAGIKAHSQSAYEFLIQGVNGRKTEMMETDPARAA